MPAGGGGDCGGHGTTGMSVGRRAASSGVSATAAILLLTTTTGPGAQPVRPLRAGATGPGSAEATARKGSRSARRLRGVEHADRRTRHTGQSCGGDQAVVEVQQFRPVQRPRLVVVGQMDGAPVPRDMKAPAGGQEPLQRCGFRDPPAYAHHGPAGRPGFRREASAAAIGDDIVLTAQVHRRPGVGQPDAQPAHERGKETGGVERPEHHAASALPVDRVQAHIGFAERAEIRQSGPRSEARAPHREGDQPDVGDPVERAGPGAGRQQPRHFLRCHRPVHEGQFVPALHESGPTHGAWGGQGDRLGFHDGHSSRGPRTAGRTELGALRRSPSP